MHHSDDRRDVNLLSTFSCRESNEQCERAALKSKYTAKDEQTVRCDLRKGTEIDEYDRGTTFRACNYLADMHRTTRWL